MLLSDHLKVVQLHSMFIRCSFDVHSHTGSLVVGTRSWLGQFGNSIGWIFDSEICPGRGRVDLKARANRWSSVVLKAKRVGGTGRGTGVTGSGRASSIFHRPMMAGNDMRLYGAFFPDFSVK